MKKNQKYEKKRPFYLKKLLSLMIAGVIAAGLPGAVYNGTPITFVNAAEADPGEAGDTSEAAETLADPDDDTSTPAEEEVNDEGEDDSAEEVPGNGEDDSETDSSNQDQFNETDKPADQTNNGSDPVQDEGDADQDANTSDVNEGTSDTDLEETDPDAESEGDENGGILKDGEFTYETDDVIVTVEFTESAGFPNGTELRVEKIDPKDGKYTDRFDSAKEWIESIYGKRDEEEKQEASSDGKTETGETTKENEEAVRENAESAETNGEPAAEETDTNEEPAAEETEADTPEPSSATDRMTREEAAVLPDLEAAELTGFALFDISFVYEGEEIEPQDTVQVSMKFSQEGFSGKTDVALIHYAEDGRTENKIVEIVPEQAFSIDRENHVEGWFESNLFSEYAVIALKTPEEKVDEKTDQTPNEESEDKKEEIYKDGKLTAEVDGVVVTVDFTKDAKIPEGTELKVRKIDQDENEYSDRIESARKWVGSKYGEPAEAAGTEEKETSSDGEQNAPEPAEENEHPEEADKGSEEKKEESADPQTEDEGSDAAPDEKGMTSEEEAILPDLERAEIGAFALFDITLVYEGKEIEPAASVRVNLRFKDEEFSKESDLVMIHYAEEDETEKKTIETVSDQEVSSSEDGVVEAAFAADSFSEYAVMALRAGPYYVWFDGTDGMGTGSDMQGRRRSLINGATNTMQTVYTNSVTLPTQASNSNNTKYVLNGWYDINTGNYYKPGDTAPISQNTVFYAEWILADYDLGPSATVVSNQPDISSFVRTDVFDYNEIFNAYHGAVLRSNQSYISNYAHSETWADSQNTSDGNDFLFTNWYYQNFGETYLGFPSNLKSGRNRYAGAGDITSGIVGSTDDQLINDLFGQSDSPGKVYLGQGDMLYQYDNNTSSRYYGYYYYDSDKNAADYNRQDQRFYIYNGTQTIRGEWNDAGRNVTGFMPFEPGTSTINQKTGQVDFWFGMVSTVDFFLPDNPGTGGNKATGGKDMEFYFSGDDDVWVFVDGELLLDLGGIHREINGAINFSDGKIYVEGRAVGTIPDSILSGDHQLQFYYLERGSSWSNASIYFNIAPRYSLELTKMDADNTNQFLEGAVFNVYADENCTIPAYLWTSKEAYEGGESSVSTFTTGANGKVECYGLYANRTYYLKEVSSPPGYPSISGKVIALQLNAYGDAVISSGDDIASLTQDGASKYINLSVTNKLPETIDIPVEKRWYNEDGSLADPGDHNSIKVELYRAEVEVSSSGSGTGGTGGNTGAVLPVNIRTQYFGTGNGANTDTAVITAGDLTSSAVVSYGGSLTLNVDVTQEYAGIYSVTVNGKTISPESTSGASAQNTQIGGRWGNYPPRHAVYKIDPVTEAMDISVTLIGYLGYGGNPHHPDTSYTMTISTTVADPPNSGSTGEEGGTEEPEIPSTMPEDAVYVDEVDLSDTNEWQHIFTALPARSDDGTRIYVYYVKEIYPDGYSTSYIGNGSIGGNISIYNVRLREIIVRKEWRDFNDSPLTEGLPETIDFTLTQHDDTSGTSRDIEVSLTAADGWTRTWRSNSPDLNEQKGHIYRYTIKEADVSDEYIVSYSQNNQTGITEGTITVTNRKRAYNIAFVKADSTDHDKKLSGARFSLYSDPDCEDEHLVEAYDSDAETAEPETVFSSGDNGEFEIYGLKAGTYYLKELSSPDGYYLIDYPLEIVITAEAGGVASVRGVRLIDGELTDVTDETPRIELVSGSLTQVFIYDSPLFELPSTGGTGSYLFIIGGIAAMAAALLLNIKIIGSCKTRSTSERS